jgi:hypothetical protein
LGIARFDWDSEADAIEAAEAATRAVDDLVVGATIERSGYGGPRSDAEHRGDSIERGQTRTRWVGFDGQIAWVERRGPTLVIVVGAPPELADQLAGELWPKKASAGRRR